MLCSVCRKIDLGCLVDEDNDIEDLHLHGSIRDLLVNSGSCDFCRLVLQSLEEKQRFFNGVPIKALVADLVEPLSSSSPIVLRAVRYVDNDKEVDDDLMGIFWVKVRCDRVGSGVYAYLSLFVDDATLNSKYGDLLGGYALGREVKPADQRMDLIKHWLETCEENHPECRLGPSPLPTRVIDVGAAASYEPRLKISNGERAHYVALSHCWGKNPIIRTMNANIEDHKKRLPNLPKTFQDAVTITREMGFRYLWIDSLCIIQMDKLDWEKESSKMCDVYSNAFFTIAAAASSDSTGGCLLPRAPEVVGNGIRLKCTRRGPDGVKVKGEISVRPQLLDFLTLSARHLHTRGWVLQERTLSRRMVHFDQDQLLWECKQCRLSEDGVPDDAFILPPNYWDGRLHSSYPYRNAASLLDKSFMSDWFNLVEKYSEKDLTYDEDKLPAMSGIATAVEKQLGEVYIAGLWLSQLGVSLLWSRAQAWLRQPLSGYRAPSWSWAALDGQVMMPSATQFESYDVYPMQVVVKVLEAKTTPAGLDPKGRLSSGFLRLQGRLKASGPRQSAPEVNETSGAMYERTVGGDGRTGIMLFDQEYEPESHAAVHGVFWLEIAVDETNRWKALILEPTANVGEFRRIGIGNGGPVSAIETKTDHNSDKSWFDDARSQVVTIV